MIMNYYPTGWEIPKAVGRVAFWSFPCFFLGPNYFHGYNPVWLYLLISGCWFFGAVVGFFLSSKKEAKIFYSVWLLAASSLAWLEYVFASYGS